MEKLARYLSRTAGVAAALTLAGATVAGARAGAAPHPGTVGGTAYHPVNLTASGSLAGKSGGTHYLYVDEGNSGGTADNIEAFKIVGTSASWLQTFPSGANQTIAFFGSNTLALRPSKKGKSECLVLTDAGNGMIRSYSVATSGSSQGQITGQVSAVADPNGYTPEQVTVSSNGTWAFLVDASAYVSTWTIAGNCGLTLASSSKGATDFPNYQQAEEVGSTQLVANDDGNNKIDTYSVNPSTGALTYTQSTSSPAIQPDGLFVSGTKVFTGALTNPTIAQAGTLQGGTVQFVQGSPAKDPSGPYGVPVFYDKKGLNVVEGDEAQSSLLSNFHLDPSTGLKFTAETSLQQSGEYTGDLTALGSTLFINGVVNGDIETCSLASGGASHCGTAVVLKNAAGYSNGLAIK